MLSCINRLRLQADAIEEAGRLLLADCAQALRQQDARGESWDDACMDLSMAREALETCGWWLRRCAEEMELAGDGIGIVRIQTLNEASAQKLRKGSAALSKK